MMQDDLSDDAQTIGIHIPQIMFPNKTVDLNKWAVVACDQYTSQPEYWESVENQVGQSSSTLKMIIPEVFLKEHDIQDRISKIDTEMKAYIDSDIIMPLGNGFILVVRETLSGTKRKGLILSVDLEQYDYTKGSKSLIRATENTVIERLPSRVNIRKNAVLEIPHILLLIDDPEFTVIDPIYAKENQLEKIYDFDLMMGGMNIRGYSIFDKELQSKIISALKQLVREQNMENRHGINDTANKLLFAVGDGNHSLAAAKAHWEELKLKIGAVELKDHPARFALVEVVNIHDEGIVFKPIHRVVFNVNIKRMFSEMANFFEKGTRGQVPCPSFSKRGTRNLSPCPLTNLHIIPFVTKKGQGYVAIENPRHTLEVGTLESFLDKYQTIETKSRIDYIHGDDTVYELVKNSEDAIGFFLPVMDKNVFFKTIFLNGVLPKKTFSMGEAQEKRYYLECRKIC